MGCGAARTRTTAQVLLDPRILERQQGACKVKNEPPGYVAGSLLFHLWPGNPRAWFAESIPRFFGVIPSAVLTSEEGLLQKDGL